METLDLEKEKLCQVLETLKSVIDKEKSNLDDIRVKWLREPAFYDGMLKLTAMHYKSLKTSLEKPYFARIDFKEEGNNANSLYIGKHGFTNELGNDQVVVDWRAPVASLYYDANLGACSYECPQGVISGDLLLKRQFDISAGVLNGYYDVDLVSNDVLLQKYLNSNNSTRIKNIISTIQQEQNDIIRRPINQNIVVQGVAGSGKTTVALHRLSYLIYNYKKYLNPNNFLVIGPNKVFLKYISSVLPDLDVDGISQKTYVDFCLDYINDKCTLEDSFIKLENIIKSNKQKDYDKYKGTLEYKNMIDLYIDDFYSKIVSRDLTIDGFVILTKDELSKIFDDALKQRNNLDSIINRVILMTSKKIVDNKSSITSRLTSKGFEDFKNAQTFEEKEKVKKFLAKTRKEIENGCKSVVKKYFDKYRLLPMALYKDFINNIEEYNCFNYENISELKDTTQKKLQKKRIDMEDLAALLYLKFRMCNTKEYDGFKHTIIDEAQDLSEFDYYSLNSILSNSTFSIFGDLAQSIYGYRSIDSWDKLKGVFDNLEIINFNKSYRTTDEIMQSANEVAKHIGLSESEPSIRHGKDVVIEEVSDERLLPHILQVVKSYLDMGHKTIAIVCKTQNEAEELSEKLNKIGLKVKAVTSNDDINDKDFNICTISNALVKGLEFDGVIIVNASEKNYSSKSDLDMKLLYVALTRALHDLDIIYNKNLTAPLLKKTK